MAVIARRAGSRSPTGLSYARCRECSGPLSSTGARACEWCGAPVELLESAWYLETVARPEAVALPTSGEAPPAWALPDLASPQDRMALLVRMAAVMAADGVVEPRERKLLRATARRWHVPYEGLEPILEGRQPAPDLAPGTEEDKGLFLLGLVMAALVDGRVDARERRMIDGVAASLHLEPGFVDEMIRAQQQQVGRKG
jgi:hypothetical protein